MEMLIFNFSPKKSLYVNLSKEFHKIKQVNTTGTQTDWIHKFIDKGRIGSSYFPVDGSIY